MPILTLKDAAVAAMQVQDACNLSGVLHSWAQCQTVLMNACHGNHSHDYRRHPVNVLFLSKVASLMQINADNIGCVTSIEDADLFQEAWEECGKISSNVPPTP